MAQQIGQRLTGLGVTLQMEPEALDLVAREGSDQDYGARPMRRYLAAQLEDRAAELLLRGELASGTALRVSAGGDGLALEVLSAAGSELV